MDFLVAVVIGVTAYSCLDLWIDYLKEKDKNANKKDVQAKSDTQG